MNAWWSSATGTDAVRLGAQLRHTARRRVGSLAGGSRNRILETVERELQPGAVAVVAELSEDSSVEVRMESTRDHHVANRRL